MNCCCILGTWRLLNALGIRLSPGIFFREYLLYRAKTGDAMTDALGSGICEFLSFLIYALKLGT